MSLATWILSWGFLFFLALTLFWLVVFLVVVSVLAFAFVVRNPRWRFRAEIALASFAGLLGLITFFFPSWIEAVFGRNPDQDEGLVERMIVVGLCVLSIAVFSLAALERGRERAYGHADNRSHR